MIENHCVWGERKGRARGGKPVVVSMFESPASGASEKFFGLFSRAKRVKKFFWGAVDPISWGGRGPFSGVRGPVVGGGVER